MIPEAAVEAALAALFPDDANVQGFKRAVQEPIVRTILEAAAQAIQEVAHTRDFNVMAEAALRSSKHLITSYSELDVLPVHAAIIGTSGRPDEWPGSPYEKAANGEWYDYLNGYHVGRDDIRLPATVTFLPKARISNEHP